MKVGDVIEIEEDRSVIRVKVTDFDANAIRGKYKFGDGIVKGLWPWSCITRMEVLPNIIKQIEVEPEL